MFISPAAGFVNRFLKKISEGRKRGSPQPTDQNYMNAILIWKWNQMAIRD
jgi:hypothetical protein